MKRNDIIFLLVCTCIVTFAWIIFSIYHASVTSTISDTLSQQIVSIKPNFDITVIDHLKERENINPLYAMVNASNSATASTPNVSASTISAQQIPSNQSIASQSASSHL